MSSKCECGGHRYKQKILHIKKKDYTIKVCIRCDKERDLEEVIKSTITNQWFLKGKDDK